MEYFDYSSGPEDFDIEEFLENSQKQEKELLRDELEQIQELLKEREQLHEDVIEELESKLDWYLERLEQEYRTPGNSDVEGLKSEIERFYTEIRTERRRHWKDKQELEQERRELLRELGELEELDLSSLL